VCVYSFGYPECQAHALLPAVACQALQYFFHVISYVASFREKKIIEHKVWVSFIFSITFV
jgi:hypothetical protein